MNQLLFRTCILLCCFLLMQEAACAQDTTDKIPIEILQGQGTTLEYIQSDSGGITKLIRHVALKQGETLMYCDSAYIDRERNNMQAWGHVRIIQDGGSTEVQSDYLRYTGNARKAFLEGNVSLTDGQNTLWCNELEYDLGTKTGVYYQGGTLQNDTTILSSRKGIYYARTKDARFMENVVVTDARYHIVSEDLGYNTDTRMVHFFGPSVVVSDSAELRTSGGIWNAREEHAWFPSRSSVLNAEQYVEADTIDFYKKTGRGEAFGQVIVVDTLQQITLYCGYARYNRLRQQMLATVKPVLKKMTEKDSLFIRSDTFYTAPVSLIGKASLLWERADTNTITDTLHTTADSSAPRFFTGYHHVRVFSDSLQARCDSISYSQVDSVLRLIDDPIAWSRNSQITGDTILLYMDSSNNLQKLYVPDKAFVVSLSGPEKAALFDQVQGKTLTGHFDSNAIREMIVRPAAECIYYSKDDAGAYLGVNQAQSEQIRMYFISGGIDRIILDQEVRHKMIPMEQINIPEMRLSRFRWHPDLRPQDKEELFR